MKIINIHSKYGNYNVVLDSKLENIISTNIDLNRNYFAFIDENIPAKFVDLLIRSIPHLAIYKLQGGEQVKTFEWYERLTYYLLSNDVKKDDCLIAVGGGTITDLIGYLAATYKRGIDYISVPTTTLAMIDASIGGKTAINVENTKNAVGIIYPPINVLIGLDTLDSLEERHINNGLLEALKMGIICDSNLYNMFLDDVIKERLEAIIQASIINKKKIVEQDEEDKKGIREILNFGHTLGHAFELNESLGLLHGEAIANGILIVSKDSNFFSEYKSILNKLNCPIIDKVDIDQTINSLLNDKKINKNGIHLVISDAIGTAKVIKTDINQIKEMLVKYGF